MMQRVLKLAGRISRRAERHPLLWCFLLPCLLFGFGFVIQGIYPFGNAQILVTDLWHQYYPFLRLLQEKLQTGGSMLYTWRSGLGTNFLSLASYYTASPLNLLVLFVPAVWLREALTLFVMMKVGFAGLFCGMLLKDLFHRRDMSLVCFSMLYALCDYMTGYYWNVMWLDTVALLPLVMLGLVWLVRDGKRWLYPLALGLSLISNYYIGYMTCIFSVLAFFVLCICLGRSIRQWLLAGIRFAYCSLIGGGLSAWLLLPAYRALGLSYSANSQFPKKALWQLDWRDMLSNLLSFQRPTSLEGLPNVSCGMLCVVLFFAFISAKKIPLREKLCAVSLLGFLFASCSLNILNYIWHGFHFTNMLPYRFSFLISFVLVVLSFRAYCTLDRWQRFQFVPILLGTGALCILSWGRQTRFAVICSGLLGIGFLLLLLARQFRQCSRRELNRILVIAVTVEMLFQVRLGNQQVGSTNREVYPRNNVQMETLLEQLSMQDANFYRAEESRTYTLNEGALMGFNGVSQFSSSANVAVTGMLKRIGLSAGENANRYCYSASTPFTNMLLGVRYVFAVDGYLPDAALYTEVLSAAPVTAYRTNYALPLGYMVEEDALNCVMTSGGNVFHNQNKLFSAMTGIPKDLFSAELPSGTRHTDITADSNHYGSYHICADSAPGRAAFDFAPTEDGIYYAYVSGGGIKNVEVDRLGIQPQSYNMERRPYLFPLGSISAGETVSIGGEIPADTDQYLTLYVYRLNQQVLEEGYQRLGDEVLTDLQVEDTVVSGNVTVKTEGMLYCSIPFEPGWSVQVDGEPAELVPLCGAMTGIRLTPGTHSIRLNYVPDGFREGVLITGASVLLLGADLAVAYVWKKRRKKVHPCEPSNA